VSLSAAQGVIRDTVSLFATGGQRVERIQRDMDKRGKMRYILMDWLVEVADLKLFSRETLYVTTTLVDRFLGRCDITRRTLQLLGIASMVIASRYVEEDVITIREAAWLTDNTYQYEEVVRTIGQTLYAVDGNLRVVTQLDFVSLYILLGKLDAKAAEIVHFVSELTLLHIPHGTHPPALLAAAIFYIALFGLGYKDCWSDRLTTWTGISLRDIAPFVLSVQQVVFRDDAVTDHRGIELSAVKDRYNRKIPEELARFQAPNIELLKSSIDSLLFDAGDQEATAIMDLGDEVDGIAFDMGDSMPVPMCAAATMGDDSMPAAMDQSEDSARSSSAPAAFPGGRAFANLTNMSRTASGQHPSKRARFAAKANLRQSTL
jgi:hypothetical protein